MESRVSQPSSSHTRPEVKVVLALPEPPTGSPPTLSPAVDPGIAFAWDCTPGPYGRPASTTRAEGPGRVLRSAFCQDERPWSLDDRSRMLVAMWIDQRGSEILPRPECVRLLALEAKAGSIGRLALSRPEAPIVQPVNFAYHEGEVLVVLGEGFMVESAPGHLVALEVDAVDRRAMMAWSVLVRGLARVADEAGLGLPTGRAPVPLAPVPGDQVLAIRLDVVTGRRFPLRPVPAHGGTGDHSRGAARRARV